MADPHDRWLFLLTVAAIPLACTEDVPIDPGDSSDTTAMPSTTGVVTGETEGSTSIATTVVDGTSSEGGETTAASTGDMSSSSSEGTTMTIEPGTSTSEGSSSTGEPQGLCELWGETWSACYGYSPEELETYCYSDLSYIDPACGPLAAMVYQCELAGCFVDCGMEDDALDECNDMVEAMELGCDMIPMVPGEGTIEAQCTDVASQAFACDAAGYYIGGFSQYVDYTLEDAVDFCSHGAYFAFLFPPPGMGDTCGGAYEDLLTCLSMLSCNELEDAVYPFNGYCQAEQDAVTCRCELGA